VVQGKRRIETPSRIGTSSKSRRTTKRSTQSSAGTACSL
jgi:hypothetical protein